MKAEIVYTNMNNAPRILLSPESGEERTLLKNVARLDAMMTTHIGEDPDDIDSWSLESVSFRVTAHHDLCEDEYAGECHPECNVGQ